VKSSPSFPENPNLSEMSKCGFCDSSARRPMIVCSGVCRKKFHADCMSVSPDALSLINSVAGVYWKCRTCSSLEFDIFGGKIDEILQNKHTDLVNILTEQLSKFKEELMTSTMNLISEKVSDIAKADRQTSVTYAEVANPVVQRKVIIKPKNPEQPNSLGKSDIQNSFNPDEEDILFSNVKPVSNGGYVLSATPTCASRFKNLVSEKLSDNYEVRELKDSQPLIRIVGLSQNYEKQQLLRLIKSQNERLFSSEKMYKY